MNGRTVYAIAGVAAIALASTIVFAYFPFVSETEAPVGGITVYSAGDLDNIHDFLGEENSDVIFEIMTDISLSDLLDESDTGWVPIGNDSAPEKRFYGTVRGNGHCISGLWLTSQPLQSGLFGALGGSGKIFDLTVEINSEKGGVIGGVTAGGIVGSNYGTIQNCFVYSTGNVGVSASVNVGGLAGYQSGGKVIDCHANVNVYATSGTTNYAGGLVGLQEYSSSITGSSAGGNVFSDGKILSNGSTRNNDNPVGKYDGDKVGGLVGMEDTGSRISDCYATGNVSSIGNDDDVGGLIGRIYNDGRVERCYSTGSVTVNGYNPFVGGFAGNIYNSLLSDCYSTGGINVTGKDVHIGSFLGFLNRADVRNCYAIGHVQTDAAGYAAGLIGYAFQCTPSASFFNTDTVQQTISIANNSSVECGLNSETMISPSTFKNAGWDLDKVWGMYSSSDGKTGYGYPYLRSFSNNILITPTEMTVEYNGKSYTDAPKWTSDGDQANITGDLCYIDENGSAVKPKDVGKYLISLGTLSAGDRYQISFTGGVHLTIEPVRIGIDLADEAITYNTGVPKHGSVNISDASKFYEGDISKLISDGKLTYASRGPNGSIYNVNTSVPVGTYDLILVGDILKNYSVDFTGKITIEPKALQTNMVSGVRDSAYTGQPIILGLSIDDHFSKLESNKDYTMEYSDNVRIGKATVTITGIDNYTGQISVEFNITGPVSVKNVVDAIYNVPETVGNDDLEALVNAYSLYVNMSPHDRGSLPSIDVDYLNNAIDSVKDSGINRAAGKVIVNGDVPWYVRANIDDIVRGSEEWDLVGSIIDEAVTYREYDILSAFNISFTDLLHDLSWHPAGEMVVSIDVGDASVFNVLYVSAGIVDVMDPPDGGLDVPVSDSGMFIVLGDEPDGGGSSIIVIAIAALLIVGLVAAYFFIYRRSG